ncbi:MAG: hypothetical protein Q8K05_16020 [Polaromonas sp.]|uniref:hypothetical protein n=1 Tax=Polaromonas sp. TaxID=1869339 RepID=UPI00272EF1C8|nr:hypothetical protein [Polaromonas sp.]MDP2257530.1 hypothetical protein [Polaromonas sp.]
MVKLSGSWSKVLAGLLLGTTCLLVVAAPPERKAPYQIDRPTLALGEPLTLSITRAMDGADTPLEALDLAPLRLDFDILERTLGRDSLEEKLLLTLYPRRTGRLELPTLGRPGHPLSVTVTESSDTVPRVYWKLSLDPAEPLVRQATTFTLEACDDGTLLWKRPSLPSSEGLLLRPLNETEIITQREGQRCTAHRWHWALLPTAAGQAAVQLPVMQASKFGQRLRFTPPALTLATQALPAWLPTETAVGKPEIAAEPLPAQAVLNQPLAWRIRVTGTYSAQALQTLLNLQMGQDDGSSELAAYAPSVETQSTMTPAPQHLVTLYLLPQARGSWQVPGLQLPWYDPQSGRLLQATIPGARIEVLDPVRQRWLTAGAALAGLAAAAWVGLWLWKIMGWRLYRRRVLRRLRQSRTPDAVYQQLLAFRLQRNAKPAATLRTWQTRTQTQCTSIGLDELIGALERSRYGISQDMTPSENPFHAADETKRMTTTSGADLENLVRLACAWLMSVKVRQKI